MSADRVTADQRKAAAADWFLNLRDRICAAFEAIEDEYAGAHSAKAPAGAQWAEAPAGRVERKSWTRRRRRHVADERQGV